MVHLALVGDAVLAVLEVAELRDVGPGGEGLVAGSGDDQGFRLPSLADAAADLGQAFIHRESKRIARLGPVKGYPADFAASQFDLQPVVPCVEQPGFDTAVEGRVVAPRIIEAIADAEQDAVLVDYDSRPSAALFIACVCEEKDR